MQSILPPITHMDALLHRKPHFQLVNRIELNTNANVYFKSPLLKEISPLHLKEIVFVVLANFIICVILIRIAKDFFLNLLSLGSGHLVSFFRLLCLTLNLSLSGLDLFVFDNVACLDDIRNSIVVQNICALLNEFFQKDCRQMDFAIGLKAEKWVSRELTNPVKAVRKTSLSGAQEMASAAPFQFVPTFKHSPHLRACFI